MKEIKAVIRPTKLPALREALLETPGFPGMTVSKAEGMSAPSRAGESRHTVREELTDYTAKIRIEIVAPDEVAGRIVDTVVRVVGTGHVGDGLVWVVPIDHAVFIHKTMPGIDAGGDGAPR